MGLSLTFRYDMYMEIRSRDEAFAHFWWYSKFVKRPRPNGLTSHLGGSELSFLTDYLHLLSGLLSYLHFNPVKLEVSGITPCPELPHSPLTNYFSCVQGASLQHRTARWVAYPGFAGARRCWAGEGRSGGHGERRAERTSRNRWGGGRRLQLVRGEVGKGKSVSFNDTAGLFFGPSRSIIITCYNNNGWTGI